MCPKLFARVREQFGDDLHLLHDCHHRLSPIEAARLGKELEPFHLFWMEDPVPAEFQEGFRVIREHTTTPIATGEVLNSIWDVHPDPDREHCWRANIEEGLTLSNDSDYGLGGAVFTGYRRRGSNWPAACGRA